MHARALKAMIQRIQTLYMMLASLAVIGLYLWFPVITDQGGEVVLTREQPSMTGLMAVGLLLVAWSIFSFKVRKRQFVLNRLAIIVNFVLLGVFVYRTLTVSGETLVSEKGIGVLLPVLSIVLLVMANKAIKRDEDLVKSVDRIR